MNNLPNCPKCNSEYVYEDGALLVCPECAYEWNPAEVEEEEGVVAIDANGNKLADGDTVTLIKDLKVKGAPKDLELFYQMGILLENKDLMQLLVWLK